MTDSYNNQTAPNHLKTFAKLKQDARGLLNGNYAQIIPFVFCYTLLTSLVVSMTPISPDTQPLLGLLQIIVVTLVGEILLSLLKVGYYKTFLQLSCKRGIRSSDLFYGFTLKPGRTAVLSLFFSGLQLLCLIPYYFYEFYGTPANDTEYLLVSLLIMGGANLLYYLITLCFSPCYFLLSDFPNLSAKEILKISVKLMKGNCIRFALLQLSFFPLLLLGSLSCGLGLLWVLPYEFTTYACFYLNLVASKEKKS